MSNQRVSILHGQEERGLPDALLLINVNGRVAQAAKHSEIAPLTRLVERDDRAGAASFQHQLQ